MNRVISLTNPSITKCIGFAFLTQNPLEMLLPEGELERPEDREIVGK
jgi:hypothetical protein